MALNIQLLLHTPTCFGCFVIEMQGSLILLAHNKLLRKHFYETKQDGIKILFMTILMAD